MELNYYFFLLKCCYELFGANIQKSDCYYQDEHKQKSPHYYQVANWTGNSIILHFKVSEPYCTKKFYYIYGFCYVKKKHEQKLHLRTFHLFRTVKTHTHTHTHTHTLVVWLGIQQQTFISNTLEMFRDSETIKNKNIKEKVNLIWFHGISNQILHSIYRSRLLSFHCSNSEEDISYQLILPS